MRSLRLPAMLALALALPAPALAETRNFGVSGFDKIRLDGPFLVRVQTGVAPSARATAASAAALQAVSLEVTGKTLVIRANRSAWGGYPGTASAPVTIDITTHDLTAVWLNGAGRLAIDKVRGLSFDVVAQGAGLVEIGAADVDRLDTRLNGSASVRVGGAARALAATLRGTTTLDASALSAKDATIAGNGSVSVRATVTNSAKVDAQGTATVALDGSPGCTIDAVGSASVTGCR